MIVHKTPVIPLALGDTHANTGFYALGVVQAFAQKWKNGLLQEKFDFHKIAAQGQDKLADVFQEIENRPESAIYLFSSFSWTHPFNMEVARFIKQKSPTSLIIFGGPEVPRRKESAQEFMQSYPQIDVGVLGEGEMTLAAILEMVFNNADQSALSEMDFSSISGLICRDKQGEFCLTETREQIKELDIIPSPYMENVFEESIFHQWIITETNRGCPFGCTYCDWGGATLSKVRKYSFDRVKNELEFLASKKVKRIFIADANFGALKRDMDIADILVKTRTELGYPKIMNTNYAKNATSRVAYIVKKLYEYDIVDKAIISFQTLDQQILENIDRGNIKTKEFENLMKVYKKNNIPMVSELLIGMPGQTQVTLLKDLDYLFKHMIIPVVYLIRVLTNAPMADPQYIKRFDIKLSENGNVISTSSFSAEDLHRMIRLNLANIVLVQEGFIKYMLYHLQVEHHIKAVDVLVKMLAISEQKEEAYHWICEFMSRMMNIKNDNIIEYLHPHWKKEKSKLALDNLDKFYADFYRLIEDEYQIQITQNEKDSLIVLQMALMKKPHRVLPDRVSTPHDVIGYFAQLKKYISLDDIDQEFKKLGDFAPGEVVTPKQFIKKLPYNYARSPGRNLPEWPLVVEGLALQPNVFYAEDLPVHHKHTLSGDGPEIAA